MEKQVISQLTALGHENRLAVFRLLMRRYPGEVAAGEVASALDLAPSTCSDYFSTLKAARLIEKRRDGTSLYYRIDIDGTRAMSQTLLGDCCKGRADLCAHDLLAPKDREAQDKWNVLFVCSGNSARSIIAESILTKLAGERFNAYSAGAKATGRIHPIVLEMLADKGHDTSALASKDLSGFTTSSAPVFDFVFTVCDSAANEECPAWPGQPVSAHWGMPDPVKATGTDAERMLAFQSAYGTLHNRILAFTSLPFEQLTAVALQRRVDEIGLGTSQKAAES